MAESVSALVLIEPDAFIGNGKRVSSYIPQYAVDSEEDYGDKQQWAKENGVNLSDIANVSRPLNGLSVKPNTHAWVQVLRSDGEPILLFNALGQSLGKMEQSGTYANSRFAEEVANGATERKLTDMAEKSKTGSDADVEQVVLTPPSTYKDGPNSTAWTDWILQSVREQRVEKTQVVETFGDTYFYAFGERPRALDFTGLLMNTLDYNWRAIFWENWDRFFRATKLIEAGARMYIGWEDVIVEGYPINATASETSESPNAMMFRFTFYITNYINTSSQAGFVSQKAARISRLRGGYMGKPTGTPAYFREPRHGIDLLGTHGADVVASKADFGGVLGRFTAQTVGRVIDGTTKGLYKYATGPGPTSAFLTNWLRNTAYTSAKFWKDYGIRQFEDAANFKSGEVNAWFGMLGDILSRMDKGSPSRGIEESTNPNWIGRRSGFDPTSGNDWMNVLKLGSLDRIIEAMAYAIPALPGYEDNTVYETAKSEGRPAGATMVHMSPHKGEPSSFNPRLDRVPGL